MYSDSLHLVVLENAGMFGWDEMRRDESLVTHDTRTCHLLAAQPSGSKLTVCRWFLCDVGNMAVGAWNSFDHESLVKRPADDSGGEVIS